MEREILHVDCNKFYASVECCLHPELRQQPVAVGGDEASRHGIVLTKNEIAAGYGLVTGEPLWSARQKCPNLVVVPPHFPTYTRFSGMVRKILADFSPVIEPFGLDEAWVDVTDRTADATATAHAIRRRVKKELGITVSVGVSFNKTFAKLGSDYKKPDAVTVFSRQNYRQLVWPLPVGELLYVGSATRRKLQERYLYTIGDVAKADPALLQALLGKWGPVLHAMANGRESQPVLPVDLRNPVQSVSNGMTTPRDLQDERDVQRVVMALAESVGRRLREQHLAGRTLELQLRENTLVNHNYRVTLDHYVQATADIAAEAFALFRQKHRWTRPLRSVTIGVSSLEADSVPYQPDLLGGESRQRRERLDAAVDSLRQRFGDSCVRRAILLEDPSLTGTSLYEAHTVHPTGFSGSLEELGGYHEP